MNRKGYNPYIAVADDGTFEGLLFFWLYDQAVYVEHLAVRPEMRGRNIGSRLVEELAERYPNRTVILEIDPPEDEISCRRKGFYERLGFKANGCYRYVHPSYLVGEQAHPHDLVLMSYPAQLTDEQTEDFVKFMASHVLPTDKEIREVNCRPVRCLRK